MAMVEAKYLPAAAAAPGDSGSADSIGPSGAAVVGDDAAAAAAAAAADGIPQRIVKVDGKVRLAV